MRTFSLMLAGCVLFVLAGHTTAQDAKKLIVGKWQTTVKGPDNVDYKIDAEFTDDGKLKVEVRGVKTPGKYSFNSDGTLDTEITFDGTTRKVVKQKVKVTQDTLELEDTKGQVSKFNRVTK